MTKREKDHHQMKNWIRFNKRCNRNPPVYDEEKKCTIYKPGCCRVPDVLLRQMNRSLPSF